MSSHELAMDNNLRAKLNQILKILELLFSFHSFSSFSSLLFLAAQVDIFVMIAPKSVLLRF